ncbi:MAG: hypothetical protein U0522_03400 [Candidatus Paceibacterota bacterium]
MATPVLKNNKKHDMKTLSKKTFQSAGKWIEKPRVSEILVCACGNKYIKTRKNQTVCVRCMR